MLNEGSKRHRADGRTGPNAEQQGEVGTMMRVMMWEGRRMTLERRERTGKAEEAEEDVNCREGQSGIP